MGIKKFDGNTNMMVVDDAFNRLMNVVDFANKNIALTNSLLAGLEERYNKQNNESLWENSDRISLTKRSWIEATENWRELITNLEEHFNYAYERGHVKYNPESLLSNADEIDYDLKKVISMCSDEDLSRYIKKIKEVQSENNQQMQNELSQNRDDNLESYWTPENYRTFLKSVEDISSNISYCYNSLNNFVDEVQEIKANKNSASENNTDKIVKIVQEISELERERMSIDNKINEKINELNTIIAKNVKNIEIEDNNEEVILNTDDKNLQLIYD